MKSRKTLLLVFILFGILLNPSFSAKKKSNGLEKENWNSNYTYVFVHGLSGWGHYDSINKFFPYWGMKNGFLIKELKKQGFKAYDASVAPQGSAWDRACELYAQLTGTVTDYGKEHSERCGHERFGRDFSKEPLIPQWDSENKINLLGHSFGGVTVRLLAHLMANGSEAERAVTDPEDLSPLFAGGHGDWIYSVTTLAAPHNGTSAYHVPDENPEAKTKMQEMMDKSNAPKKDGRADYDYADYDMHIQNAQKINQWLKTIDSAYYFSYASSATQLSDQGKQIPLEGMMEELFIRSSLRLGSFEGQTPDGIVLGKEWQENDGLVNTISAYAPDFAPKEDYSQDKALKKGIWYVMPLYKGDHMAFQGGLTIKNDINPFYIKHLDMINRL
ncbi:MAG: hypothetical protein K5866_07785 [Treponema sp.]|nr:hypothetical protein [Treponema sp.]